MALNYKETVPVRLKGSSQHGQLYDLSGLKTPNPKLSTTHPAISRDRTFRNGIEFQ